MSTIGRRFFARDTVAVARDLLGVRVVRAFADGRRLAGRIVETEAYPPGDPASHASRGETARCRAMFGAAGTAYVYLIYGVHWCVNVVTERTGVGAAVLVRGLDRIEACNGPGRLCRVLGIDASLDGVDLLDPTSPLRLLARRGPVMEPVVVSTRIGITRAASEPYRFYLAGSPGVSRRDSTAEAAAALRVD